MQTWLRLILAILVCGLAGCTKKPYVVVLPDSRTLQPAILCPVGMTCVVDPGRLMIDKGYLREIMQNLRACSE